MAGTRRSLALGLKTMPRHSCRRHAGSACAASDLRQQPRKDKTLLLTRRSLVSTAVATPALILTRQAAAAEDLVIPTYGGRWEKFWREILLPGLADSTGVSGRLTTGLSSTFSTTLRAAGKNASPMSVFMAAEGFSSQLRAEGYFAPLTLDKVPNLSSVHPFLRNKDDVGVRAIISPIGIGYRTDLVKTPPKSWSDLWDNPEFRGRTGLYQIGATYGILFFCLTATLFGGSQDAIDVAFTRIKQLLPFRQADFSGSLSTLLARGDIRVAAIDFAEIVALKQRGVPVEMVVPSEGVMASEGSLDLVRAGGQKDEALKYINYLLSAPVQRRMAQEFYTAPANAEVVLGPEYDSSVPVRGEMLKSVIQFDWTRLNAHLPEIVARWNREVR
jgi:putative spermidine/putrescine transport system substrate-binding protein